MDIAFNINNLAMEGLGATLVSLIKNCSDSSSLKLWFLHSDLDSENIRIINNLLSEEHYRGEIIFVPFDANKEFGHMHSLHGDWTAYGRLLIPSIVQNDCKKVLYLDTDLIVNLDVTKLFSIDFDKPIAAVNGSTFKYVLEQHFFLSILEMNPDNYFFNSGVLLFNIEKWNSLEIDNKVKSFGEKYGDEFRSADQTLLNGVFCGDFYFLDKKYNSLWYPHLEEFDKQDKIIHFVGSPKPWDYFGRKLHKGREIFFEYTPKWWLDHYSKFSFKKLYRTYKIKKSIIRLIKRRIS